MIRLPPVWFVGCGHMAGALIAGWQKADVDFAEALAIRPSGRPVPGIRTLTTLPEKAPAPARCVLGFKPQALATVAPALSPRLSSETVLVSMLAGVEARTLRSLFPNVAAVVRIMPNLAVGEREGVTALFSDDASAQLRERMTLLFGLLGEAVWAESESGLGAIGALAAAGPAYVARFVAALAAAGRERGLDGKLADRLALATVRGTALMASRSEESMDEVARRVASPNGTTEAGLAVLDNGGALDRLVAETIAAAARRGEQLAAEARGVDSPSSLP